MKFEELKRASQTQWLEFPATLGDWLKNPTKDTMLTTTVQTQPSCLYIELVIKKVR